MFGPFRPGDLVAKQIKEVPVGGFFLAYGLVGLRAASPATLGLSSTSLVQFDPHGTPGAASWDGDLHCMAISTPCRLEASLSGLISSPDKGSIGIHTSGALAVTVETRSGGWGYLQLGKALATNDQPPGYVWSLSWRLELVLGDGDGYARLPLAERS